MNSIYLSEGLDTAGLETKAIFRTGGGTLMPVAHHPWVMVTIQGTVNDVIDLTDDNVQRALATTLSELTGEWAYTQEQGKKPPTQVLGRAAYDSTTVTGLLYVSARNPPHRNLVVFTDRMSASRSHLTVADQTGRLVQQLP